MAGVAGLSGRGWNDENPAYGVLVVQVCPLGAVFREILQPGSRKPLV